MIPPAIVLFWAAPALILLVIHLYLNNNTGQVVELRQGVARTIRKQGNFVIPNFGGIKLQKKL